MANNCVVARRVSQHGPPATECTKYAFATDGSPEQALGICSILGALSALPHPIAATPWILICSPKGAHIEIRKRISAMVSLSGVAFLDAEVSSTDKYYVQISLDQVFTRLGNEEQVLCLDYDHAVLKAPPWSLPDTASRVLVSSEFRRAPDNCARSPRDASASLTLNTSLILGRGSTLRPIAPLWRAMYRRIEGRVPKRFQVEIAFGLACYRARIHVERCQAEFQSCFSKSVEECALFHYGGTTEDSAKLKACLVKGATGGGNQKWNQRVVTTTGDITQAIVNILKAQFPPV